MLDRKMTAQLRQIVMEKNSGKIVAVFWVLAHSPES